MPALPVADVSQGRVTRSELESVRAGLKRAAEDYWRNGEMRRLYDVEQQILEADKQLAELKEAEARRSE